MKTKQQKSLDRWTKQEWTTPSGKRSKDTGEVYAPKRTIAKLKSSEKGRAKLANANRKKREATSQGKQFASHGLHKGVKRKNGGDLSELFKSGGWITKSIKKPGSLTASAKRKGMSISEFCSQKNLSTLSKRRCNLAKTLKGFKK